MSREEIAKIIYDEVYGEEWEHSGDCTNECHTCWACLCLNAADKLIQAQLPKEAHGG